MAFYNKSGGDRGRRPFGGNERGERELFNATCAQCGNSCQVPFRPNGTKPVFCNNCFQREEKPQFSRPSYDGGFSRPSAPRPSAPDVDKYKIQFDMINSKLDRILKFVSPVVTIEPSTPDDVVKPKVKKAKKSAA